MIREYAEYLESRLAQHEEELPAAWSLLQLTKAAHSLSMGWRIWELPRAQQEALRQHEQGGGSVALLMRRVHQPAPQARAA